MVHKNYVSGSGTWIVWCHKSATTLLNAAYPGDYRLEGDVAYLLYKGDVDITREYSLFDQFKEDTGLDITLFYQDTRVLTTLYNAQGDRIVGSGAPDVVIRDVLNTGEDHFISTLWSMEGLIFLL